MSTLSISFARIGNIYRILVNGEDVSDFLRLPEVNNTVSQISKIPEVRTALILIQQRL
jgi:cytidylate kinase